MAEYIERDALFRKIDGEQFYDNADKNEIVLPLIDGFPAADVEPVVHAHWISKVEIVRGRYAQNYYCSNCLHKQLEIGDRCSCCGAHMDEEVTQDG